MKKIYVIAIIGIFLLSGLGAVANHIDTMEISKTLNFSKPVEYKDDKYVVLRVNNCDNSLKVEGKPEMPLVPYSIDLPFGVKNIKVSVAVSEEQKIKLIQKIKPTPQVIEDILLIGMIIKYLLV